MATDDDTRALELFSQLAEVIGVRFQRVRTEIIFWGILYVHHG